MREDSYGTLKRYQACELLLSDGRARRVLDVGCGTGVNLTAPLARRFPACEFIGMDADEDSIRFASATNCLSNLHFTTGPLSVDDRFDVIIASEVIEHVDQPGDFLSFLRSRLSPDGCVFLTLPNGVGPFELSSLLMNAGLACYPICYALVRVKRAWGSARRRQRSTKSTLANSPHVNFFTKRSLTRLIEGRGFEVLTFGGRTFLCGPFLDQLVSLLSLQHWNAAVGDKLPLTATSGWMLVLRPSAETRTRTEAEIRLGWYSRFKRAVNRAAADNEVTAKRRVHDLAAVKSEF